MLVFVFPFPPPGMNIVITRRWRAVWTLLSFVVVLQVFIFLSICFSKTLQTCFSIEVAAPLAGHLCLARKMNVCKVTLVVWRLTKQLHLFVYDLFMIICEAAAIKRNKASCFWCFHHWCHSFYKVLQQSLVQYQQAMNHVVTLRWIIQFKQVSKSVTKDVERETELKVILTFINQRHS